MNLNDIQSIILEPEFRTHNVNNLIATSWYVISIRAKTCNGFSLKCSASIESGYPPEIPSPPTNLEIISMDNDL